MSSFFPQGTFFGLDLMSTSLQSFSVAENVTGDNISNVDTPGATTQTVDLTEAPPVVGSPFPSTNVPGTVGDGVVVASIQRANVESYDELFRGASSSQNYYSTEQQILTSVQSQLGDPDAGVSTAYTNFQTAVTQLVNASATGDPESAASGVLTSAQALAQALGDSSAAITSAENQTISQGATIVQTVNGLLDQIAALNGQIRSSTAVGDDPNTFEDERDYDIDQLSQYISTQTSVQADGSVLVMVNGQALVNDTVAYNLAAPVVGTASNGTPSFNVYFATDPPQSSSSPSIPLGSGQLAALQDLYNNKLSNYNTQLNQFASSLSTEVNRITESGYDSNAESGTALFQPIDAQLPISAGNIECGITDPDQLPVVLANTEANTSTTTGIVPMNSANNTVDTSTALINNGALANPPTAAFPANPASPAAPVSYLTITVNGVAQQFAYTSSPPPATGAVPGEIYADNVQDFVSSFNALQSGVTASYDSSSQEIVFQRDPTNESLALRGAQQGNAQTASFTISDSNYAAATPNTSLLGVLGAGNINGVEQNASNAYGEDDNGVANALTAMFQSNVGFPGLEMLGTVTANAGQPTTVALPSGVNDLQVGQQLTLSAATGGPNYPTNDQENVTITAISVDPTTGVESVTFTPQYTHTGPYTITTAQTQTLQQQYGQLVTQVGLDTQTANTGVTTQTNLASTIDQERQSIAGINIDDQTQDLIKYQTAYQAAAKTISTLSQLLDTIVTGLGVGS
ncbi:MAG TPA: flagellar basal body rod C-terminal domain-containing protein [Candidatus Baltobacteraceae bacterium]|nr:flagellar basal body rod C-terminal domain-containing protein [Candidatus Baltobacteraceae bacterium]